MAEVVTMLQLCRHCEGIGKRATEARLPTLCFYCRRAGNLLPKIRDDYFLVSFVGDCFACQQPKAGEAVTSYFGKKLENATNNNRRYNSIYPNLNYQLIYLTEVFLQIDYQIAHWHYQLLRLP